MDPGTAWEIGYGIARDLPVYAWTEHSDNLRLRAQIYFGVHSGSNISVDQNGWIIEDFGLTENLMIAISCASIHSNADEAISACAAALGNPQN